MPTHTTHSRSDTPRIVTRFAWVPLFVLLAALVYSAVSGQTVVHRAQASTIVVQGSVDSGVFIDATQCANSAGVIGDVFLGTDGWRTAQDSSGQVCRLTFGASGSATGADLILIDDPATAGSAGPALRCTVGACAGKSIADYSASAEPAANTSAFGAQLLSAGGDATAVWTPAPAVNALGDDDADVSCHTSFTADGDCTFTWGVTGAANETPGNYVAHVQSLAVVR